MMHVTHLWPRIGLTSAVAFALVAGTVALGSSDQPQSPESVSPTTTANLSPLSERRVVTGWISHHDFAAGLASVTGHPDVISEVSPFWYRATTQSEVAAQTDNALPETTLVDGIASLHAVGIAALPTVTDQGFTATTMARLLSNADRRTALVDAMEAMVVRTGADGVDIDFEAMNFTGSGSDRTTVKEQFPVFLRQLRARLHGLGGLLSVAVPARLSANDPNWEVFDYRAIGRSVDRVRVMTYDYSSSGSAPGPIGPLEWTRNVVAYATSQFVGVPLSIGVPQYGQNWYVKTVQGTCPSAVKGTVSPTSQQALSLITQYSADPVWSAADGEYHFDYRRPYAEYGDCVALRRVWFGEARSALVRLQLAQKLGVQGIAVWRLGVEDPGLWTKAQTFAQGVVPSAADSALTAPPSVGYGTSFELTGQFSVAGLPVQGGEVTVQRRVPGGTWGSLGTVPTDPSGTVVSLQSASRTFEWRLRLAPEWDWSTSVTRAVTVAVRHVVAASVVDPTVSPGQRFTVTGTVAPPSPQTTVLLQKRANGTWVTMARSVAVDGAFSLKGSFSSVEVHRVRVVASADAQHAAGVSATMTVTVE